MEAKVEESNFRGAVEVKYTAGGCWENNNVFFFANWGPLWLNFT